MAGYDPSKANEVNQLIEQGLTPEEAIQMAGIPANELGNYSYDATTSQLGPEIGPPTTQSSLNLSSDPSQFPAYDDDGNLQLGFAINDETGQPYYRGFDITRDQPVNPASDPSQFPAYDDDGNLQLGFAINDETGQPYYRGFPSQDATNRPFLTNLDPQYAGYSVAGLTFPETDNPANLNDPYYGLTPKQLQDLGGADPTDPYIRARLGIPQLPGSTLAATPGFGSIKTGVPLIDNALNFLGGLFGSRTPTLPTPAAPPVNPVSDPSQFPAYDDDGNLQPGFAINEETGGTYYRGFPYQDATNTPVNPASDPSQFPAYDDDGNLQPGFAINDETGGTYYRGFPYQDATNTPVNPASDPSQFPAYDDDGNLQPGFAINEETGGTYYRGFPYQNTTNTPVNPASDPSQFPAYDDDGNLQPGFAINEETGDTYYQGFERNTDRPVNPASDPSQFPAYDDDGNLQPGFAINDETGETYYQGFERTYNEPLNPDEDPFEQSRYEAELAYNAQEPYEFAALAVDDPYYGLTPQQIQDLGGADPTDPYIRARLGIPQLPGSTLAATPGFGTIKTGVPLIDNALNFLGGLFGGRPATPPTPAAPPVSPTSDPSQFPAYDDDGNLMPGFAINEETGEPYYQGFERNTDQPVNPASDPSQFPAYDDDGNLQPGFAINEETGQPYYQGFPQPTANADVDLDADSGYGSDLAYTPTDTAALSVDATKVRASNPDLSPEAQQNLNNINLANANVVEAQGNIQSNNLNILRAEESIATARETQRQAEAIIAQNNAELADPFITDERRAELLANNAEQEASIAENAAFIDEQTQYIEDVQANTAEQQGNILENQLIAEENAAAFRENDGGELLTVEPDLDPELQQPDEEVIVDTTDPADVDPETDLELQEPPDAELELAALAEPVNPDADPELLGGPEDENLVVEADEALDVDPIEDEALQEPPDAEVELTELAEPVDPDADPELLGGPDPEVDPFEPLQEPPDVDAEESPELLGGPEEEVDPFEPLQEPPDVDAEESPELLGGPGDEEPDEPELLGGPEDVDAQESPELRTPDGEEEAGAVAETGLREPTEEDVAAANEAATRQRAKEQATFQARYKQTGNQDWRVRLSLSPNANYLYNAGTPRGSGAGILAPLAATDGVIFPYTPSITTNYTANYEQYDLVHSNYRGVYYKNSRVGDIGIRGTFTAQDTTEANYLLAVIHFFRSATKMFYGQDAERGTPPPVCLLNGLGQYQFSDHPVVISSFNYTTPTDVDYIRATNPNNFGSNLLNRRAAVASNPGGSSVAGLNRLLNALPTGLSKGAIPNVPAPGTVNQSVNNTAGATYVPTKMEIDITLIPVQTRAQVSKQFSLKGFANGDLLKGGFW